MTAQRRAPAGDDTGVVAIVVALSVSTFLLGFAALAVDLGSAYARKAELQSIADRLTLAGARGLPSVPAALTEIGRALAKTCRDEATPGVCRPDGTAPGIGWATDGQPENGEVSFFVDPDGDGDYRATDRVGANGTAAATALRVQVANSTVEFGLAGALGVDSATLTRSATGRIGTPLGAGLLPFALTAADLLDGQFCVRDPGPGTGPAPAPGPSPSPSPDPDPDPGPDPGPGPDPDPGPDDPPAAPPTPDACEQPGAERGFAALARSDGSSGALEQNIRSGPDVHLFPATGPIGGSGPVGTGGDCGATAFVPATSCLSITTGPFSPALTAGFLDPGGRLLGDCGNDTTMSHSRGGVDDSHLFTDPGFITVAGHFSRSELRARITAGVPATPSDRGWLTSKILTCPRLAVMPVIDPATAATPVGGERSIVAFRYVWIDDETDVGHRGLGGDGSQVTSFRGYVVDPGYLPAVVSGSASVGPYLGGTMPKEVMLMTDLIG